MQDLINEPDPARLVAGLRCTGYDFQTAAADIVDNSIAAEADNVFIRVEMDNTGEKFVYFGDNGHGMDEHGLKKAMQLGAPARENPASLGKFGLGLKTASFAICKRLTVISRKSPDAPLVKLAWDIDHIEETGEWLMLSEKIEPHEQEAWDQIGGSDSTGTLVVWSKCDRILSRNYASPGGAHAQAAIQQIREDVKEHLGTIYHRFLDHSDNRQRNVNVEVNGELIKPWNPFESKLSEQVISENKRTIEIMSENGDTSGVVKIGAWIFRHSNSLSESENNMAKISYANQGFYIYREGRLINKGGWLGLFRTHGDFDLLRIEFDLGHELDDDFNVDVKKSVVRLDTKTQTDLKEMLTPFRREARNTLQRGQKRRAVAMNADHSPANNTIRSTKNTITPTIDKIDGDENTATITNSKGAKIHIKHPIQNNANPNSIHVESVDTIDSIDLWIPRIRSSGKEDHVLGVEINRKHDFYQKIYLHALANSYPVQGMDLLFWAFAVAEFNNTNKELDPIFEDIREMVSTNLRRLLRDMPIPNIQDDEDESE